MTEPTPPGRFVWYDLMSSDPERSLAFYTELFGYRVTEQEVPPGSGSVYRKLHLGDRPVAGILHNAQPDAPSHWMSYLSTGDVAATTAEIERLGGKVFFGPIEVPGQATFAICGDDQGAHFSVIDPAQPMPAAQAGDTTAGLVCWNELWAHDPEAANRFYAAVCGWQQEASDMGAFVYWLQKRGGEQVAGVAPSQVPGAPPYWCPYFTAEAIDATTERALAAGAQSILPPTDIPGVGRFSVISEPTGAVFALFSHA